MCETHQKARLERLRYGGLAIAICRVRLLHTINSMVQPIVLRRVSNPAL
jgi:hypothetical protein